MKKIFIVILVACFAFGCAGTHTARSICDTNQESMICEKIDNPEAADVLLQLANYELLKQGVFSKKDIQDFFHDIELILDNTTTWSDLVFYVTNRVEYLKNTVGTELFIISQYAGVLNQPLPINEFDRNLLRIHVERQKKIVQMFNEG